MDLGAFATIFPNISYYLNLLKDFLPALIISMSLLVISTRIKAWLLSKNPYTVTSIEKWLLLVAFAEIISSTAYVIGFDSGFFFGAFVIAYIIGVIAEFARMNEDDEFSLMSISSLYVLSAIFIDSLSASIIYIVFYIAIIAATFFFSTKIANVLDLKKIEKSDIAIWAITLFLALISCSLGIAHAFLGLETIHAIIGVMLVYAMSSLIEALIWYYQKN